jgi:hypothetical protein
MYLNQKRDQQERIRERKRERGREEYTAAVDKIKEQDERRP